MYRYTIPTPIIVNLCDKQGFILRKRASDFVDANTVKGAERGNRNEQSYGALSEIVIRSLLNLPIERGQSLGFDILLPSGIKLDVKCRGGAFPFQPLYDGPDHFKREAKHNFFARQLHDKKLDTDVYLLTHLQTSSKGILPGSTREKKWNLFICGWVSKGRVVKEGVFLPRGSLTEQGRTWFTYRGQEIEFYHRHLNGLHEVKELLQLDKKDVKEDARRHGNLHLTSVDALRIALDLRGRGILTEKQLDFVKSALSVDAKVRPILHPNQYHHFMQWLINQQQADQTTMDRLLDFIKSEDFSGI